MKLNRLERDVLLSNRLDLLKAALVASGVNTAGGLVIRQEQVAALLDAFRSQTVTAGAPEGLAHSLFGWLWKRKPQRYRSGATFQLDRVLDAQMDPSQPTVGNCLGLTVLYNVLAQKLGLQVGAIHLEQAFGRGPHVLSLLMLKDRLVDIENSLPKGFGYTGHLALPDREVWGDSQLVADVYVSQGNAHFDAGEPRAALEQYDRALLLAPTYRAARLSKGMALAALGRDSEATRCLV